MKVWGKLCTNEQSHSAGGNLQIGTHFFFSTTLQQVRFKYWKGNAFDVSIPLLEICSINWTGAQKVE